jgi:hypothetical protein
MNVVNQAHLQLGASLGALPAQMKTSPSPTPQPFEQEVDPVLPQAVLEHGSPLVVMVLMIWLFKVLTQFVKACKDE